MVCFDFIVRQLLFLLVLAAIIFIITRHYEYLNSKSELVHIVYPRERPLFFLKTHKTGSTTVTALLLRKCFRDKKNCFIPDARHPGKTFRIRDLNEIKHGKGLYGGRYPYDVWCHHAQYDPRLLSVVNNEHNPLFITIVRRPALRFASAFYW